VAALVLFVFVAGLSPNAVKPFVPKVPDLTLKIRSTTVGDPITRTMYFKGARQRVEATIDARVSHEFVITQCDKRRTLMMNDETKTYASSPIVDVSVYFRERVRTLRSLPPSPIETTVTTRTTDTGERRPIGPYIARHVLSTRRSEFSRTGKIELTESDAWYVDLPVDCVDGAALAELRDTTPWGGGIQMVLEGSGRRGYFLMGKFHSSATQNGSTSPTLLPSATDELLELSERPLDAALFDVPPEYRPAPQGRGGPDASRHRVETSGPHGR
jgi:hypothetical protein